MPKLLILTGILLIATGVAFNVFGKIPWIGKLPGDICVKQDQFTFYFPLTTCILASLLLRFFFLWKR